jgi:hypothetical protein
MSTVDVRTIASTGVAAAKMLVVNEANAARVSPALGSGNVDVICMDSNFVAATCQNNTAPANVRVTISNFSITLGGVLPLYYGAGQASVEKTLAPGTTMPYLN